VADWTPIRSGPGAEAAPGKLIHNHAEPNDIYHAIGQEKLKAYMGAGQGPDMKADMQTAVDVSSAIRK
jgi:hypothetical protein